MSARPNAIEVPQSTHPFDRISTRLVGLHAIRSQIAWVGYCFRTTGGPLVRFALRATFTSTRLAILMKGMPLFIP